MKDFKTDALNLIKSNLEGLPSFCRLVVYELLEYCDYKSGIIAINTLDELAHNDFRVAFSPGRKKEVITGDTLRNAFRTKPEHFKFTTKNQRIIIEMPFLRELHQKYFSELSQVTAVDATETSTPTTQIAVDETINLDAWFIGEEAPEVAAASSRCIEDNINNKKQTTTITSQINTYECQGLKSPISADFAPNSETIERALALGYLSATDRTEIQAFIDHNKATGSRFVDYNPIYLRWLAKSRERQDQKQALNSGRLNHAGSNPNKTHQSTAIERVKQAYANEFAFCETTRRYHTGVEHETRVHSHTVVANY